MSGRWGRVQRVGAVALVVGSLAFAGAGSCWDPAVPFLGARAGAEWIGAPRPVSPALEQWGAERAPVVSFEPPLARFRMGESASLRVEALGRYRVFVRDVLVAEGWRGPADVPLPHGLQAAARPLRVEVENVRGPALLWLRSQGVEPAIVSSAAWRVSVDGAARDAAEVADDTRPLPGGAEVETPLAALRGRAPWLVGLLVLGALGFEAARRHLSPQHFAGLPSAVLWSATLVWAWLFVAKLSRIPTLVGFDARHHLQYVELLRAGHLPLATDGWSTYHPPLFHAAAALLAPLGEASLHVLPWLGGVGTVFVAHALAVRLFPDDPRPQLLAVLFAATLPMNLALSAYFSNESVHAALLGVALVATVDALRAAQMRPRQALWVGLALGAAALVKFTALAVAPVALLFLGVKLVAVERAGLRRVALLLGLVSATLALVAGWFYLRNALALGAPLVGNWNLPGPGRSWWQQPGFHTAAYYTSFGESLVHPYQAGFHSFWDGIYSTLWGDGGIAGRAAPAQRHGFWNYGFMSASYLLALPICGLLMAGGVICCRAALHGRELRRRMVWSFLLTTTYAVAFSTFYLTLVLPYFAQAKAFYALGVTGPLALCFAAGASWVDEACARRGWPFARALHAGLLATSFAFFFLGFAA